MTTGWIHGGSRWAGAAFLVAAVAAAGLGGRLVAAARTQPPTSPCTAAAKVRPTAAGAAGMSAVLPDVPMTPFFEVSENCSPWPLYAAPYGGALTAGPQYWQTGFPQPQLTRYPATAPMVVLPSGDAFAVIGDGSLGKQRLEEVAPSGHVLWSIDGVPGTTLAADAQVVVVAGLTSALLVNPVSHQTVTVPMPGAEIFNNMQAGVIAAVGVVRGYAILENSFEYSMGEGGGGPGQVAIYDSAGHEVKTFTRPDAASCSDFDTPEDNAFIQTQGSTAYIAFTNAPFGQKAGLYTFSAAGKLAGPYPLPAGPTDAADQGGMLLLPGARVVVDTWRYSGRAEAAMFQLRNGRLVALWSRSYAATGPLVWGGTYLLAETSASTGGRGPGAATLERLDWRTGKPESGTKPIRDHGMAVRVLAAGPWGVLVRATDPSLQCPLTGCSASLQLLRLTGSVAWSVALQVATGDLQPSVSPQLAVIGGHMTLFVGPPGLAVSWGGAGSTAPGSAWSFAAQSVGLGPAATRGPARGYQVYDQGTPVTAATPLVVTAAEVNKPISVTVAPATASGQTVAAVGGVFVRLSATGTGGSITSVYGRNQVELRPGDTSAAFTFTATVAGSYVIAASSGGPDQDPTDLVPTAPAMVEAGGTFAVDVLPWDSNGVAYPLAQHLTVQIAAASGAQPSPADARPLPSGAYQASVHATGPANTAARFTTSLFVGGQPYGNGSGPAGVAIVRAPAPSLGVVAAHTPDARLSLAPAQGSRPIAYALYREQSGQASSGSTGAPPFVVVDAGSGGTDSLPLPAGSTALYRAAALYADGALSPLSLAVRP